MDDIMIGILVMVATCAVVYAVVEIVQFIGFDDDGGY
jgi:hypothetical protein